jgi:hypothetical protein
MSLICAVMKPISPGPDFGSLLDLGPHTADAVDQMLCAPIMNLICWPFLSVPFTTRTG